MPHDYFGVFQQNPPKADVQAMDSAAITLMSWTINLAGNRQIFTILHPNNPLGRVATIPHPCLNSYSGMGWGAEWLRKLRDQTVAQRQLPPALIRLLSL
jgi:hypothetical protein